MTTKRVHYREGDWFAVPLRSGGYGVGRIARAKPKSPILFGYFWGPRFEHVPPLAVVEGFHGQESVLVTRFGDLGIINGTWPLIGSAILSREEWLLPDFIRSHPLNGKSLVITYNPDNLTNEVVSRPASDAEIEMLPWDAISGFGAVEIRLTKLLSDQQPG